MQKLFTEFEPTTAAQWKEQLIKDLKGTAYESLVWHTANGFEVKPFYTREDLEKAPEPVFAHSNWEIGECITVTNEDEANRRAMAALNGGASALSFCLDGDTDAERLLKDILIEHIGVEFILNSKPNLWMASLNQLITKRELNPAALNIAVNYDVLAHLAEHGSWLETREADLDAFRETKAAFARPVIDATLYQNTGANQVTELSLILSHYNEYLNTAGADMFRNGVQFNVSVGSDFFAEIAKLRALRKLIALVHETYGIDPAVYISCTTSRLTLTAQDAYTNLLRSTTQAMSAVIGGCNSLYVLPFDELNEAENRNFSLRMARNQQIILKEESYLDKAADIGAGSYYIETLTEQLASAAFEAFKVLESKGGFISCLEQEVIQDLVKQQAGDLRTKAVGGELMIIGANKYINANDRYIPKKEAPQAFSKTQLFMPLKALQLAKSFETTQPIA